MLRVVTQPHQNPSTSDALTSVAVYQREVRASLDRIWENVLDWEHLPWLHRESFRSVGRVQVGPWGWRARVGLWPDGEIDLELAVEREHGRYVARTLEGPGAGTEIWTQLSSVSAASTEVEVAFHVPAVAPEQALAVGRAFVSLYTKLWDQDESMIARRAALLAHPHPAGEHALGPLARLRGRLPLDLELGGRPVRVLELDGEVVAYFSTCPHRLGPLRADGEPALLRCPWHGYAFDLRRRASCDGRSLRMKPGPRVRIEGPDQEVRLEWR